MSIQDESFPDDEFIDELNFSTNAGIRFQFPHHHRRFCPQAEYKPPPSSASTNTSSSSSSSNDQNFSSSDGRPLSVLSSKTAESDPTGLADIASKKSDLNADQQQSKSVSYQDLHSEYTKRRFKHVQSKVGQYIANMKAEDQKRRNSAKFQRHRSMPEALSSAEVVAARRSSANELHKMYASTTTASDAEEEMETAANSSENTSGDGGGITSSAASTSGEGGRHESSDECGMRPATNFIDKQAYAQLVSEKEMLLHEKERIQSYSDYLQTRLDEKIGENMRLKRNVDFMRIELTNAKDKLKKQNSMGGGSSRQSLLYFQAKSTIATQTELLTPSPSPLQLPPLLTRDILDFVTPSTPDANNNSVFGGGGAVAASSSCKGGKSVATIQPLALNFSNIIEQDSNDNGGGNISNSNGGVLRQRTNSNPITKTPKPVSGNSGCPSSGDSAIGIESAELRSSKVSLRKLSSPNQRGKGCRGAEKEFIYYDKRSDRYATLEASVNVSDASAADIRRYDENDESLGVTAVSSTETGQRKVIKKHQHNSLRRRWLRLFGPCTRCQDHNQTLDSSALQQTYTQIPLLEKSFENHCRNLR